MSAIKALHVRLEGWSASFRHPLSLSGTQMSTPVPAYSHLLGMISACAGRVVGPNETRIGFEFRCQSRDQELERTVRWQVDKNDGQLKPHREGQGISFREVYWHPQLDLFVTNLDLRISFEEPVATPCFGRSQDIAWIRWCREVTLHPLAEGALGPTLIPYPQAGIAGLQVRLPEYFDNSVLGRPRRPGPFGHYQAMPPTGGMRFQVKRDDLFHPSDAARQEDAIYLHRWLNYA